MWESLCVSIIMMIISYAIQSSSQVTPKDPEPGKLDIPTVDEGKAVSVIFGTCLVKSAHVGWYGDPSTQTVRAGGGGKK